MNKYMTQSGFYTAEIIKHIKASNNQPVVAILTDIETGLQEVACYTNDLKYFSDRKPSGFDLVEVLPTATLKSESQAQKSSRLLKNILLSHPEILKGAAQYELTEAGKFICSDEVCRQAGVWA